MYLLKIGVNKLSCPTELILNEMGLFWQIRFVAGINNITKVVNVQPGLFFGRVFITEFTLTNDPLLEDLVNGIIYLQPGRYTAYIENELGLAYRGLAEVLFPTGLTIPIAPSTINITTYNND
jgi:hypothetical protein